MAKQKTKKELEQENALLKKLLEEALAKVPNVNLPTPAWHAPTFCPHHTRIC